MTEAADRSCLSGPIVLLGFMGCGKSTLGPLLALVMGLPFLDLDAEIERRAGRDIPQIFRDTGEAGFRRLERELFRELRPRFHGVISIGGGLPAQPGLAGEIAEHCRAVYLEVPAEELQRRLEGRGGGRPMLDPDRSAEQGDLGDRIRELVGEREAAYRRAGRRLEYIEGEEITDTLDRLLELVREDRD